LVSAGEIYNFSSENAFPETILAVRGLFLIKYVITKLPMDSKFRCSCATGG